MCLYLPRFAGKIVDDAPEEAHVADPGHGETVLVIDDEPAVRMLMVEVLEEAGYVVIEANDGPNGLKILQSNARIDLLVTDVGLSEPTRPNRSPISKMRSITPNCPLKSEVLITGLQYWIASCRTLGEALLKMSTYSIAKDTKHVQRASKVLHGAAAEIQKQLARCGE